MFLRALLEYNSHTRKFTPLKYTGQQFLVNHKVVKRSSRSNSGTFSSTPKGIHNPQQAFPFPPSSPNPRATKPTINLLSVSINMPAQDISYKSNHVISGLFVSGLFYLLAYVLNIHPRHSTHQYFTSHSFAVVHRRMNRSYHIYPSIG